MLRVSTYSLKDGDGTFEVTVVEPAAPSRVVLFAVGGGGNPERHLPLLTALAAHGCAVTAPHFARMTSPIPTDEGLRLRVRRSRLAADAIARPALPVAGVGHSLGGAVLLALAGGEIWRGPGGPIAIPPEDRLLDRLDRIAVMAPATGFFRAPAALDAVRTPILAWAATNDTIAPPAQAQLLAEVIGPRVPVTVRVTEGAGHFSFMDSAPPNTTEPLADRDAFLSEVRAEVIRFVTA
jgi:alpha-beta hydrolase superfamily lysophospholipase